MGKKVKKSLCKTGESGETVLARRGMMIKGSNGGLRWEGKLQGGFWEKKAFLM